jgi:tetratricopeptide (TPR) repeat protein
MAVLLAAGIFVAAGCESQQQAPQQQATRMERGVAEAMEQAAPQLEQAAPAVEAVEQTVPKANAMVDQAQALLAQAKELLDTGKLDEAIAVAQQVLSIDPQNLDAQNIIAMAQEKLAAMAATQVEGVKSDVSGVMDQLGGGK